MMDPVQIIPSSIGVGKEETVVVIFPCDIPQDKLITLELSYDQSLGKSGWSSWVPGQPLGLKSLQAKLPEVPHAGELDVFVKVSRETFSPYPKFKLHVNSPVESIFRCVSTSSQQGGSNTPLACIAAYLLHTHEKDQSTLSYTDTIVCRILQSQPTEWNLSSLIFGKYGANESLLHLFVRCKLNGAASILLENSRGKETILQQQDYRGRTPAEIARKKGNKRIAEMLDAAITKPATNYENTVLSGKLKKSKSLEQEQLHSVVPTDEDIGPLPLHVTTKPTGMKQMFHKMRSRLGGDKKGATSTMQPSTPTHPESIQPETPLSDGPPLPPRSPSAHSTSLDPSIIEQRQSTIEPLQQLLNRCIYTASALVDYRWENSPFGDEFSLKKGDVVYVIKEMGNGLCQGVCNNFYCTIPQNILAASTLEQEDYEPMSVGDSSDDYEEMDEGAYDIPDISDIQPGPLQPPSLHTPAASVPERQFKPPAMRPAIKSPAMRPAIKRPAMRPAIKARDSKPQPIPGRLLPDCNLSSSHDSGLDRLGMPRQVSKGKLQSYQDPTSGESKQGVVARPGRPTVRVPREMRSSLQPTTTPNSQVPPPDSDSNEEYDDAISVAQIQNQRKKQQHIKERSARPPVKNPVARAASCGVWQTHTPPAIKQRKSVCMSGKNRTQSPVIRPASGGSASPTISDLVKRFENK